MLTLSVFPYILSYQQLSPVLIRLVLGAIMIYWAYTGLRATGTSGKQSGAQKGLDVLEGILGLMLVVGLWTQVAALILAVGFVVCIIQKIRTGTFLTSGVYYMLILLVLALSLLVTGPGWWAFDYPL